MITNVSVKVWGDLACFTLPELKVERVSSRLMGPSPARGVLDAILFRPQMRWHVRRISVLEPWRLPSDPERPPYQMISVRRNEIQNKVSTTVVKGWMNDPAGIEPYYVDSAGREGIQGQHRAQRNTLALRDVAYLIDATPLLTDRANQPRQRPLSDDESPGPDTVAKYVAMFQRRVKNGQCFHRPYLGCREFACQFAPPDGTERCVKWSESLGLMLYDLRYRSDGRHEPGFFEAVVTDGVLHCDTLAPGPNAEAPITIKGWSKEDAA